MTESNINTGSVRMSGEGGKKSFFRRYPKLTLISFVALVIIMIDFLAGLVFIPFDYNAFRTPSPYYHHGLLPNQEALTIWGYEEMTIHTNSLGFKDKGCRDVPLKTDKKRLVFLGDSFTEGVGIDYEGTFVGLIDSALGDAHYDVLNAGVLSYSPILYYYKTKYLVEELGLDIDELYVFIDISDINDETQYKSFEPYPDDLYTRLHISIRRFFYRYSFIYHSIQRVMQENMLEDVPSDEFTNFAWLGEAFVGDFRVDAHPEEEEHRPIAAWTVNKEVYNDWGKKGLDLAIDHMTKLMMLCKDHGIKLSVGVYPWMLQIKLGDKESIQVQVWRQFCKRYNLQFINLFPLFINDMPPKYIYKAFFIDGDVHWNEKGHRLVARYIMNYIKQNKL
jgi:hypothetical protein